MAERLFVEEVNTRFFDHCFVTLGLIENDSRTLNIARTLLKKGQRTCIIGLGSEDSEQALSHLDVTIIPVTRYNDRRFLTLWRDFIRAVYPLTHKIKAQNYWSQDLYILPWVTLLAKVNNGRLIYDAREVYTALGPVHDSPFKQKVISGLERYLIHKVDEVYTSGDLDSDYLQNLYGIRRPHVVRNLPPYQEVKKTQKIREYFGLNEDVDIILYQGLLGKGRGILKIIRALPHLDNTVLCLIGQGALTDAIISLAQKLHVSDNVLFRGWVPYDELMPWTSSADLGLAYIEPVSLSYQFALPNKLFEYCMAGIPSLVSDLPAMRPILEKYDIGKLVPPETEIPKLAELIEELLQDQNRGSYKEQCRSASKEYNWEKQEDMILHIANL